MGSHSASRAAQRAGRLPLLALIAASCAPQAQIRDLPESDPADAASALDASPFDAGGPVDAAVDRDAAAGVDTAAGDAAQRPDTALAVDVSIGNPDAGVDAAPPLPVDDAVIVAANFPDALACGETRSVTISVENRGTASWSDPVYQLGAPGDRDPFHGSRVALAGGAVATYGRHDFVLDLFAPCAATTFRSSWQMVRDGTSWFGAVASHDIAVGCATPDGESALASAIIVNSPADIASWSVTTTITQLVLGADGVAIEFSKKDGAERWPDVTPPGWDGPLQYTLWLMLNVGGQWWASGIIQFWYGLPASGGDVTQNDQIAINWVYDGRWGGMQGHQPWPGEFVGFMVSSGNQRGVLDDSQAPVRERSNMVIIAFPASSGAVFTF